MFPLLNSKQRAFLRSKANSEGADPPPGKGRALRTPPAPGGGRLAARELIKGKVLETAPFPAGEAAEQVAQAVCAEVVQVIGRTFVLYRRNQKEPKIQLPKA